MNREGGFVPAFLVGLLMLFLFGVVSVLRIGESRP